MDEPPERRDGAPDDTGDDAGGDAGGDVEDPDFGPSGYLPERASRRARKIILRAPLGLQWVVGAVLVGVVVAVAGWVAFRDTAPGPPYVEVPSEVTTAAGGVALWEPPDGTEQVLVVTAGNRSRVFDWPGGDAPVLCAASGLLEGPDDRAWRVTGRGLGGTASLAEHPVVIHDGILHVDPTTLLEPPPPDPDRADRACT